MVRIDLHTHSVASPDGALTIHDYEYILASGRLDSVAVTDHNRIDFALKLQEALGDTIIVGEEITAKEGEIIGLYLQTSIPAGLSVSETIDRIHAQDALVYIPHPFETVRKGIPLNVLNQIANKVDIIELYNGRTLQNRSGLTRKWAGEYTVVGASSSDAHGRRGWGRTASILTELPTRTTLLKLLQNAEYDTTSTGAVGRFYPKLNRLRKYHA
jgi:predicted metal-dependent phosphoesterase TrpH